MRLAISLFAGGVAEGLGGMEWSKEGVDTGDGTTVFPDSAASFA